MTEYFLKTIYEWIKNHTNFQNFHGVYFMKCFIEVQFISLVSRVQLIIESIIGKRYDYSNKQKMIQLEEGKLININKKEQNNTSEMELKSLKNEVQPFSLLDDSKFEEKNCYTSEETPLLLDVDQDDNSFG